MERENKAMAGKAANFDPGSVEDKRSWKSSRARVCVYARASIEERRVKRRGDGGEEKAAPDAHPPSSIHSFSPGPFGFESKGGGTLWVREAVVPFFFFSRFFSFPLPSLHLCLALPPRFDPLYAPVCRQKNGARACTPRQEGRSRGETPGKSRQ